MTSLTTRLRESALLAGRSKKGHVHSFRSPCYEYDIFIIPDKPRVGRH